MALLDPEDLKKKFDEILKVTESLPEKYQIKAFEILLKNMISRPVSTAIPQVNTEIQGNEIKGQKDFIIPIDVRVLLSQYTISDDVIEKLFLIQGQEIRPKYKITTTKKSKAQIQLALLLALENALKGNEFVFSQETVRERCNEHKVYDSGNFITTFKNNDKLFKTLDKKERIELSPDGKSELAETIQEFIKNG